MISGLVFGAAANDYLRFSRAMLWLFLAVVVYTLSRVFVYVSGYDAPSDAYNDLSALLVYRILMLASAIYASAVISQEVEQKTIVYLVTRPIPRPTLLLSRMAAAMLAVAAISIVMALAASLATHGGGALANPYFVRDVKGLIFGSLAYGSFFTLVTLLVNRAMLVNLLIAFVWEGVAANMTGNVYLLSIFSYLKAVAEKPTSVSQGFIGALAGTRSLEHIPLANAVVVLTVLIVVCASLSAVWFKRNAYLPREDTE